MCVSVCALCVCSASRENALHSPQQTLSAQDAGSLCKSPQTTGSDVHKDASLSMILHKHSLFTPTSQQPIVWRRRSETPHPHKGRDCGPESRPPHVRRGPGTHQDSAGQRLGRYHHPRPVFHGGHPADLGRHCLLFFIHGLESAIRLAWAIVNLLGLLATERTRIETWAPRGFKKHILPKRIKARRTPAEVELVWRYRGQEEGMDYGFDCFF